MAKIIAWLIVIFVVLLALRIINTRSARARRGTSGTKNTVNTGAPMVRCVNCGVFLPRSDALPARDGFACADGHCAKP
jgi:hypothetical protein